MATTGAGTGRRFLLLLALSIPFVFAAPFSPAWSHDSPRQSWPADSPNNTWAPGGPSNNSPFGAPSSTFSPSSETDVVAPQVSSSAVSSQESNVWVTTTVYATVTVIGAPTAASTTAESSVSPVLPTTTATAPTSAVPTSAVPSSAAPTPVTTPVAPGTMRLSFVNNIAEDPVYAYLTGTDSTGRLVMLTQTGEFYYPAASGDVPEPIPESANVAISLNGFGQTTELLIPEYVSSARLWVSQKLPLQFSITTGGLVEPAAVNDQDPNNNTNWGFIEFTFNSAEDGGLFTNLSFVDFIGLPLGMTVSGANNTVNSVLGPHKTAKEEVCHRLKAQSTIDGQPWDQLCKTNDQGQLIRVVSPQTLVTQNTSAFATYFDSYVDAVWSQFATTPLVIETQGDNGPINCTATGETLMCTGDDTPFTKPGAGDIFGCASGPFANTGNAVHLAAVPRICAAFNRATLHLPGGNVQPYLPPSHYYAPPATNFYSRFVHDAEIDGQGYAFAYDDVSPDMSEWNTAGLIAEPNPELLTVYVGGYQGNRG